MKLRKILALLVAMVMALGCVGITAMAEETVVGDTTLNPIEDTKYYNDKEVDLNGGVLVVKAQIVANSGTVTIKNGTIDASQITKDLTESLFRARGKLVLDNVTINANSNHKIRYLFAGVNDVTVKNSIINAANVENIAYGDSDSGSVKVTLDNTKLYMTSGCSRIAGTGGGIAFTVQNESLIDAVGLSDRCFRNTTVVIDNSTVDVDGCENFIKNDDGKSDIPVINGSTLSVDGYTDTAGAIISTMKASASCDITVNGEKYTSVNVIEDTQQGLSGSGTESDPYIISDIDDLKWFRDDVNAGNDYSGKYVKLTADIDLTGENWTPIGTESAPFKGTFDGQNHTISNMIVNGEANQGFFGYADLATIKNLKINNATVTGTDCVGGIAGQVYSSSRIENCHVSGSIKIEGQTNVGGIVGKYYVKVSGSSVIGDGVGTSYVKGVYKASNLEGDNVGGIMGHGGETNKFVDNTVKNITISGTRKIGGIVGTTNRATNVTECVVENVNIVTTATADYANGKADSMGLGGLIGHYYGDSDGGNISNNTVDSVAFSATKEAKFEAGPIVGNDRTNVGNEPVGVTFSGNAISAVTGSTNTYLMPAVAQIGDDKYTTLAEAFAAADGKTVTLLSDITLTETVTVLAGKTITLDLNGETISGTSSESTSYSLIANNGNLTIMDSSDEKSGKITYQYNGASSDYSFKWGNYTIANHGTLTVESGTIENTTNLTGHMYDAIDNYSGATTVIKDGTISCPNYVAIRMFATSIETDNSVTINGGTISGKYTLWTQNTTNNSEKPVRATLALKGGTITATDGGVALFINEFSDAFEITKTDKVMITAPEGYEWVGSGDTYTLVKAAPELPNATVTVLEPITLKAREYTVWNGSSTEGTEDLPLEIVMNFKANDTEEESIASGYNKWLVDFNLKFTGLTEGSITANNCYLAGKYGDYDWIVIPTDGTKLDEGVSYPVVANYDATLNYNDICTSVKDFTAAIHVDQAILDANPDFKVELSLVMTNPDDPNDKLIIGEPAVYTAEDLKNKEEQLSGLFVLRNTTAIAREGYDDPYYRVRVYSAIDSLDYKEVGFCYRVSGNENYSTGTTKDVYTTRKITNTTTNETTTLTPGFIAPGFGNYIFAFNIWANSANFLSDTSIDVRPYAVKKDGTQMYLSDWKTINGLIKK